MWRYVTLAGPAILLFMACSANPTAEEAVRSFGPVYCQRLKDCYPDAFGTVFPGDVNGCVQKLVDGLGSKKDATDACSSDEIDACKNDTKNLACGATLDATTLPSSCQKC
jgi:hypothetical protein